MASLAVAREGGAAARDHGVPRPSRLLVAALMLFILICVFDPADLLLGLKIHVFIACWFILALEALGVPGRTSFHRGLIVYVLVFIAVPAASILWYVFSSGSEPFAGFQLFKGYLLISLALVLYAGNVNLLPQLSGGLVLLAVAIIVTFVVLAAMPELYAPFSVVGAASGVFFLDNRDYGGGLVLRQVYYVTSPMLAIAIAHYFEQARTHRGAARWWFGALAALCAAAMFIAGTRNNMAVAVLLPFTLVVLSSRRAVETLLAAAAGLVILAIVFSEQILQLLDPTETSNSLKLMLLQDYDRLLSDPLTLFAGNGLGAYDYWNTRAAYFYISELTYFELLRNFGVFGGLVIFGLLIYPIVYAFFLRPTYPERHIVTAYAFYLVMCASNPNLFSSMGILLLAVILANMFAFQSGRRDASRRAAS